MTYWLDETRGGPVEVHFLYTFFAALRKKVCIIKSLRGAATA
jgi:hypothetical protein